VSFFTPHFDTSVCESTRLSTSGLLNQTKSFVSQSCFCAYPSDGSGVLSSTLKIVQRFQGIAATASRIWTQNISLLRLASLATWFKPMVSSKLNATVLPRFFLANFLSPCQPVLSGDRTWHNRKEKNVSCLCLQ